MMDTGTGNGVVADARERLYNQIEECISLRAVLAGANAILQSLPARDEDEALQWLWRLICDAEKRTEDIRLVIDEAATALSVYAKPAAGLEAG